MKPTQKPIARAVKVNWKVSESPRLLRRMTSVALHRSQNLRQPSAGTVKKGKGIPVLAKLKKIGRALQIFGTKFETTIIAPANALLTGKMRAKPSVETHATC